MNSPCRKILQLSLLVSVAASAPAKEGNRPRPEPAKLQIRLYDYAKLSPAMMGWATEEAANVLLGAGVPTRWLDCSMSVPDEKLDPACRVSPRPTDLVLKIMPRDMAERFTVPAGSFGFALLPSKQGRFGREAMVFYDRVTELATDRESYRSVVLGHLLAHEIGHLLLGSGSHSSHGIMRGTWQNADLEEAIRGKMHFSSHQAKRLREQFLKRVKAATVPSSH